MSTEEDPHVGTVRFELPDGSVDTRALVGVADEADKAGAVEATVPAKKTETIKIDEELAHSTPKVPRHRRIR